MEVGEVVEEGGGAYPVFCGEGGLAVVAGPEVLGVVRTWRVDEEGFDAPVGDGKVDVVAAECVACGYCGCCGVVCH